MTLRRRMLAASLLGLTAFPAGAVVITGNDGPDASLGGTANDDTIYGDPLAGMGPITAIKRVSTASPVGGVQAQTEDGAESTSPRFSADGRYMVFVSRSKTLVPGVVEGDAFLDVYLKDLWTGVVTRISKPHDGSNTSDGDSTVPDISLDGMTIVYQTAATNMLVTADNNGVDDIILRYSAFDSHALNSYKDANGDHSAQGGNSLNPVFSPDGTKVAFWSYADNLLGNGIDMNNSADVFVRDLSTGVVVRVSTTASDGFNTQPANGDSGQPVFSPDGKSIAFYSLATNLVPSNGDTNGQPDIFVKSLADDSIVRVSVKNNGDQAMGGASYSPVFSPDGSMVAFRTLAPNLDPNVTDANGKFDVYVRDIAKNKTIMVSAKLSNGLQFAGNDTSDQAAFSPDGAKIAFRSAAVALVDGDGNGAADIFVRDLKSGTVSRVSTAAADGNGSAVEGEASSSDPIFLSDGKRIAFTSSSANLLGSTPDTNNAGDIFIADLAKPVGGDDVIDGAGGNDIIFGGPGNDQVHGGSGSDVAAYDGPRARYVVNAVDANNLTVIDTAGVEGTDTVALQEVETLQFNGVAYDIGNPGPDNHPPEIAGPSTLSVKAGGTVVLQLSVTDLDLDDVIYSFPVPPTAGSVVFDANGTVSYTAGTEFATKDAFTIKVSDFWGGSSTLSVAVTIAAKQTGGAEANTFVGGAGNDGFDGGAGNDRLYGAGGNDVLNGGPGNDLLDGGTGADTMTGGPGNDTFIVDNTFDKVIEAKNGGTDTVKAVVDYTLPANVENGSLRGKETGKSLTGNTLANRLACTASFCRLSGGDGADTLIGSNGADRLAGGSGNDVLTGNAGADILTGGSGRDVFRFLKITDSAPKTADNLADFSASRGDRIDLSAVDANPKRVKRQPFTFIGTRRFSGRIGELRFVKGTLQGDTTGKRRATFKILLPGVKKLPASALKLK